ncbi:carbamoyltransferase HypF, partial [bacterium]|nr:carbamoyltransferase HypF [bacterium]
DGSFWGCEFIVANLETFQRMAHLHYLPMPGGTSAIREPWRMAATYLNHAYGEKFLSLDLDFVKRLDLQKWKLLEKMHSRELNSPLTSSMGRCFDAVSSLLGIRDRIHYEGEAAIELEMIASKDHTDHYRFEVPEEGSTIELSPVIIGIVNDILAEIPPAQIAARFHNAVADLILQMAIRIKEKTRLNRVVLSGGVFQNTLLLNQTIARLTADLFDVYFHHRVPANDGGISLGQAVIADARIKAGKL